MQDGFYHNTPGYPPTRRLGPSSTFPDANVPGQDPLSREYPGPLPHHVPQSEAIHPRNGAGYGVAHRSQASGLPSLQYGTGHVTSLQGHSMGQSSRLASLQLYSVQPVSVPRSPAAVQNAYGGAYPSLTPNDTVSSSSAGSFLQLPVPSQRFDLTGQRYSPPQMPVPQPSFRPTGKRKALLIGIDYARHWNPVLRLRWCLEDVYSMANFLHYNLGFAREDICIMTDETPWNLPNKANILREMRTLVHNAQPHDSLFFYFSGHATYIRDLDGDDLDGYDQCICAIDYAGNFNHQDENPDTPGIIVDDIMHEIMVKPLPEHCRLTAIFDSCHSGTLLDLPYVYDSNGVVKMIRHPDRLMVLRMKSSYADVVSLGASRDNQRARETSRGGALRLAFIDCMTTSGNNVTYKGLIWNVREYMKRHLVPQRPQLSSSHEIGSEGELGAITPDTESELGIKETGWKWIIWEIPCPIALDPFASTHIRGHDGQNTATAGPVISAGAE